MELSHWFKSRVLVLNSESSRGLISRTQKASNGHRMPKTQSAVVVLLLRNIVERKAA